MINNNKRTPEQRLLDALSHQQIASPLYRRYERLLNLRQTCKDNCPTAQTCSLSQTISAYETVLEDIELWGRATQ